MEAAAELDSYVDKEKIKEKRDKERQKERARVEKDKENDEGNANNTLLMPFSIPWIPHFLIPKIDMYYVSKVSHTWSDLTETIKVYDGYGALRKRFFRTITVHKQCSRDELLLAAMRAFVVSQESRNFYLLDVYANSEGERDEEIVDPTPVMVTSAS